MEPAAKEKQRPSRLLAMLAAIVLLAIGTATPALASGASTSISRNSHHGVWAEIGELASGSSRANASTATDFERRLRRNGVGFLPCPKGASREFGKARGRIQAVAMAGDRLRLNQETPTGSCRGASGSW